MSFQYTCNSEALVKGNNFSFLLDNEWQAKPNKFWNLIFLIFNEPYIYIYMVKWWQWNLFIKLM